MMPILREHFFYVLLFSFYTVRLVNFIGYLRLNFIGLFIYAHKFNHLCSIYIYLLYCSIHTGANGILAISLLVLAPRRQCGLIHDDDIGPM